MRDYKGPGPDGSALTRKQALAAFVGYTDHNKSAMQLRRLGADSQPRSRLAHANSESVFSKSRVLKRGQ